MDCNDMADREDLLAPAWFKTDGSALVAGRYIKRWCFDYIAYICNHGVVLFSSHYFIFILTS